MDIFGVVVFGVVFGFKLLFLEFDVEFEFIVIFVGESSSLKCWKSNVAIVVNVVSMNISVYICLYLCLNDLFCVFWCFKYLGVFNNDFRSFSFRDVVSSSFRVIFFVFFFCLIVLEYCVVVVVYCLECLNDLFVWLSVGLWLFIVLVLLFDCV